MPAKIRQPDRTALIVKEDALEVVGFGRHAYLWIGDQDGRCARTVSGKQLQDLFNAIRRARSAPPYRRNWASRNGVHNCDCLCHDAAHGGTADPNCPCYKVDGAP